MPISKHKEESWQWFFYMTPKHRKQKQKLTSGMTSNQKASIDQRKQQNEKTICRMGEKYLQTISLIKG